MLSVGTILRRERERRGITLAQVEKRIKVREKFLLAIEGEKWEIFSSKVYITGIIKNYSDFLDLDPKKILAFFRRDYERHEEVRFKKRVASRYLAPQTKKIALFGLAGVFIIFFTYFGFQLKQYLSPPVITIVSPTVDRFKKTDKIEVAGKTDKDAMINIYGERVYQDNNGIFKYEMPLKIGKNVLLIEVTGANGKKTTLTREFYRE